MGADIVIKIHNEMCSRLSHHHRLHRASATAAAVLGVEGEGGGLAPAVQLLVQLARYKVAVGVALALLQQEGHAVLH